MFTKKILLVLVSVLLSCVSAFATPPYNGTIHIEPFILTSNDQSAFASLSYAGQGTREMFDRRVAKYVTLQPYLFNANYDDGLHIEIQVNPEFGSVNAAQVIAQKYAIVIGRLPHVLRSDVKTSSIHQGRMPFGGGNNNLLIHTGMADEYESQGILEEALLHESTHTSLDSRYASAPGWLAAQRSDPDFISTYARDNPTTEDVAETYLTYLALQYRSNRVLNSFQGSVLAAVPNRIFFFANQPLDLYPMTARPAVFDGSHLNLSAVVVGSDRYVASLDLLPGGGPLTLVLNNARLAPNSAPQAAAFANGNVVIPEVAFNGSTYSMELVMTKSAPMTFVVTKATRLY
jgi:hypothetical protein